MKKIDLKKFNKDKGMFKLQTGEDVVGVDTDEENRLIYIINRGGELVTSLATKESPTYKIDHIKDNPDQTNSETTTRK